MTRRIEYISSELMLLMRNAEKRGALGDTAKTVWSGRDPKDSAQYFGDKGDTWPAEECARRALEIDSSERNQLWVIDLLVGTYELAASAAKSWNTNLATEYSGTAKRLREHWKEY